MAFEVPSSATSAGPFGYPVFTHKVSTDVSYLAAARMLLAQPDCFYPQFAAHNAPYHRCNDHGCGAIRPYEFQRLLRFAAVVHNVAASPIAVAIVLIRIHQAEK